MAVVIRLCYLGEYEGLHPALFGRMMNGFHLVVTCQDHWRIP
jgi:hypothetical protein